MIPLIRCCFWGILFFGSLAALAGCSGVKTDYSKVDLASVAGAVTLDGQPLPNATVVFEAEDGSYSYGRTNASGHYSLMFNSEKSGVTPGVKTIRIRTQGGLGETVEEEPADETGEGEGSGPKTAEELVPACYNKNSKLKATVEPGSHTINFDLKADCSVSGPTS